MQKFGIDISVWQKGFDFDKAKAEGVEFAILRGAYHMSKDSCFEGFYAACKARSIPVGVYLYSMARTVEDAKAEAKYLINNVLKGKQFEYPIYMDIEDKVQRSLGKDLLTEIVVSFCEALEEAGYYAGIYSTASFLSSYTHEQQLFAYDKWIAQWSKKCSYKGSYGLWQFGGETNLLRSNKVAGVVCDQNYALKDYPSIIRVSGRNGLASAVQKEDKPEDSVHDAPALGDLKFNVGDIVSFSGTKHYASTNAITGKPTKPGKVKVTSICQSGRHPYHCRSVNDSGVFIGGVYGWVDASDLTDIVEKEQKPTSTSTPPATSAIKKGDVVSIMPDATYYNGADVPDWVISKQWIVAEAPHGDRIVINKSVDGKYSINSAIHARFLIVAGADELWTPKVGDIVNYKGVKHYVNANADNGSACQGGLAKITNIYQLDKSKHPYHLVRVSGKGATVWGWVDEGTFTKA